MYTDKIYFKTKISDTEIIKLTEDNNDNLDAAIGAADSLIDSYLKSVVEIPMAAPPEIIRQLSYDIAVFYLHDRIQYNEIPERVKDKYDAALNFLKDIAAHKANLPLPSDNIKKGIYFESQNNVFDRNTF
ncbi:MAG: DUF1320 domain-containing protein [Bacteroidota bacterium]|nr:DUF1320 domain-containing protein [Bacteroidota bacterium]